MELLLVRAYFPSGTNGDLFVDGVFCSHTIELPWKDNHRGISCIPEGRYPVRKRFSLKRQWHLEVSQVPGRSLILIHAANDALHELQGCIAPVTAFTMPGCGTFSRKALLHLNELVFAALSRKEQVFLTIKQK